MPKPPKVSEDIERHLLQFMAKAKAAWPAFSTPVPDFSSFLAEQILPKQIDDMELLVEKAGDLYLAYACAKGEAQAIEAFCSKCLFDMRAALKQMSLSQADNEEVIQQVLKKLFVGEKGQLPKISQYNGQGFLIDWVRIVTVRQALNCLHGRQKERPESMDSLADHIVKGENQELSYLKKMYRQQFKQAFQQAFETLCVRERNVLRQHIIHKMTLDQVAALYRVSRITVSRWMAAIRKKLFQETRTTLTHALQVNRTEFNSIMRLIQSQLDVSIHRYLQHKDKAK